MADEYFEVAIVGGGPAGAVTAAYLGRAGLRVCVLEQKRFPRQKVCGEFVAPAGWAVFEDLDITARMRRHAGPELRTLAAYPQYGPVLSGSLPPDDSGRYARAISRDVMDELLLQYAAELGARVLQPAHVLHVQGGSRDGFVLTVAGRTNAVHARAVVMAHGLSRSLPLQPPLRPTPAPVLARGPRSNDYLCFKAHLEHVELEDHTTAIGGVEGLYVGLLRTGDAAGKSQALYNLAFVVERETFLRHGSATALYCYMQTHNPGLGRCLRHARLRTDWLGCGPMEPGIRHIYEDGQFFVGNAAGEVHALIGEGMTLALGAARILAQTIIAQRGQLGAGGDLSAIGTTYRRSWLKEFSGRFQAGNVFSRMLMRPMLSAVVAAYVQEYPEILEACIRWSGKSGDGVQNIAVV